jgi:YgiT-type zinc finger domain-containing protein
MEDKLLISECPSCGSGKIRKVRKDWSREFRGLKYTVPSLEYYECPVCGEQIYDRQALRKIQEHSPATKKHHGRKAA